MDDAQYQLELCKLLGVQGPMGELMLEGKHFLAYKLPDGSCKHIETPSTDTQRAVIIQELRVHIGLIEARRSGEDPCGQPPLEN